MLTKVDLNEMSLQCCKNLDQSLGKHTFNPSVTDPYPTLVTMKCLIWVKIEPACLPPFMHAAAAHKFNLSFQHPRVTKREKILMMPTPPPSSKVTFPQRRSCRGCPSSLLLGCGSHLKDSRNLLHSFSTSSEKDVITIRS